MRLQEHKTTVNNGSRSCGGCVKRPLQFLLSISSGKKRMRIILVVVPLLLGGFLLLGNLQLTAMIDMPTTKAFKKIAAYSNQTNNRTWTKKEEETYGERCVRLRGTSGHWYANDTFGRETFYPNGFRSGKWFRQTYSRNKSAVYEGNRYAWEDTSLEESSSDCQIRPVNQNIFCDVAQALQIKRMLFVGDSLMGHQVDSLRKLIAMKDAVANCPNSNSSGGGDNPSFWHVEIIYERQNLGPNFGKTIISENRTDAKDRQQFGPEDPYCGGVKYGQPITPGEYCPWQKLYNNKTATAGVADDYDVNAGRTLIVLNQGAHFHSMETFRDSFDWFVELFNKIAIPRDIVVYRSTVPGHRDCFNARNTTIPEMTHEKFMELFATDMYDWNLFDSYNRYAKQKMERDLSSKVTGHYLNVYNMTVLRPDQHVAAKDCLHYTLPGPIDYWNHLLFTNLADMAKQKSIK